MACVRIFLYALALQIAACFVAFYTSHNLRAVLTEEDFLIENLSVLFFLAGGIYGCWCLSQSMVHRGAFLLVAALGFVGFLDELSFGERLFGFSMPTIAGVKIDGVHDLVRLPLRPLRLWLRDSPSAFAAVKVAMLGAAGAAILAALVYRQRLRDCWRFLIELPVRQAWSIFVVLLTLAILLDEKLIRLEVVAIVEELLEMNAALALILVAWCTARQDEMSGNSNCQNDPKAAGAQTE